MRPLAKQVVLRATKVFTVQTSHSLPQYLAQMGHSQMELDGQNVPSVVQGIFAPPRHK